MRRQRSPLRGSSSFLTFEPVTVLANLLAYNKPVYQQSC